MLKLLFSNAINKSWRQHPTKLKLYTHLPPITKTIQVRRTRHAGHCWRSKDELIRDILLWTPTYGRAKAGRPARTYIQQLCEDTRCSPEDLPEAMNYREKCRERVRDIRAGGTTWWWWWYPIGLAKGRQKIQNQLYSSWKLTLCRILLIAEGLGKYLYIRVYWRVFILTELFFDDYFIYTCIISYIFIYFPVMDR